MNVIQAKDKYKGDVLQKLFLFLRTEKTRKSSQTLYTTTSVCIYSILFSINFLKVMAGRIGYFLFDLILI